MRFVFSLLLFPILASAQIVRDGVSVSTIDGVDLSDGSIDGISVPSGSNPIELIDVGSPVYAGSGDVVVPLPTTYAENDLLVIAYTTRSTSGATPPGGWNVLLSQTDGSVLRMYVFWKFAAASESAPTITSATANTVVAQMAAIRNTDAVTPLVAGTVQYDASLSSTEFGLAPAVSPVEDNGAVIVYSNGHNDASGSQTVLSGDGLTWETIGDASTTLGSDACLSWQIGIGSGSITMTDKTIQRSTTGVVSQSVQIAVNP